MTGGILNSRIKADLTLVFVALLWGSAFAVQRAVSNQIGVLTFNGLRFLLASMILLGVLMVMGGFGYFIGKHKIKPIKHLTLHTSPYKDIRFIFLAGILLFSASFFQQAGIRYTTAGNAGFITTLYVVLVPILLWLFWRVRISQNTWISASLAVFGSLLLSMEMKFGLSNGDALVLTGALFWGLHVILISRVGWRVGVLSFAFGQYLVAGILNLFVGLFMEGPDLFGLNVAGWAIAYTAIFSIALGYTLQIFAQRYSPPADAAIILSMEAVFATLFGYVYLEESLALHQMIGGVLILLAILITAIKTNKTSLLDNQEISASQ